MLRSSLLERVAAIVEVWDRDILCYRKVQIYSRVIQKAPMIPKNQEIQRLAGLATRHKME
jgi:hypothetical protein